MSPLANAIVAFLDVHSQELMECLGGQTPLKTFQVEFHTLSAFVLMYPKQAGLLQVKVEPKKGVSASVVMTTVLDVDGQWFSFQGHLDQEVFLANLRAKAANAAPDRPTKKTPAPTLEFFSETIEPYTARGPHSVIQSYLEKHFPAFLAEEQANSLGATDTPNIQSTVIKRL